MENPIKMDDLGVPLFLEHPFSCGVEDVHLPQENISNASTRATPSAY